MKNEATYLTSAPEVDAMRFVQQVWDPEFDKSSLSAEQVLSWICSARDVISASQPLPISYEPDWTKRTNFNSLFKKIARDLLACTGLPQEVLFELNEFSNSSPLIFRNNGCLYTFDLFSSRIPTWKVDLAEFVGQKGLQILEVGSFEGLASVWLLSNVATSDSARLVSVDRFEYDVAPTLIYRRNLSAHGLTERVTVHRGEINKSLESLPSSQFDIIHIDFLFNTNEFVEIPAMAWKLLKRSGLMLIDDVRLRCHPVYSFMWSVCKPELGIERFVGAFCNDFRTVRDDYYLVLQKL